MNTTLLSGPFGREEGRVDGGAGPEALSFVEVRSDHFMFVTNRAHFRGNVQVKEAGGEMDCGVLTLISTGAEGGFERIEAEQGVLIRQGGSQVEAERAVYEGGVLELTGGRPVWLVQERSGSSEILRIYPERRRFEAEGDVRMKLPLGAVVSLGGRSDLNGPGEPGEKKNSVIEIFADEVEHEELYTLFYGNVRAEDEQVRLLSRFLTVLYAGGEPVEILAEEDVRIQAGERMARGDRAAYDVGEGRVRLTGRPEITMPDRNLRAETFLLDQEKESFHMKGNFQIRIRPGSMRGPGEDRTAKP